MRRSGHIYLYLRANDSFGGGGGGGAPPIVYEAAAAAAGFDGGTTVVPFASTCFSWAMISGSDHGSNHMKDSWSEIVIRDLNQLPFFLGLLVKSLGPSSLIATFFRFLRGSSDQKDSSLLLLLLRKCLCLCFSSSPLNGFTWDFHTFSLF